MPRRLNDPSFGAVEPGGRNGFQDAERRGHRSLGGEQTRCHHHVSYACYSLNMRLLAVLLLIAVAASSAAQQPLETETARLPLRGTSSLNFAYEFQTSPQGTEHAMPVAFEYGVTNRLALLVEPVFFTSIRPKQGRRASGAGDLELTVQWLTNDETSRRPAFALAAEVKIPTATDTLIGT